MFDRLAKSTENVMSTSSRTLKQIAYQQLKEFLLIAVYLW